jgi:hypothetical protein
MSFSFPCFLLSVAGGLFLFIDPMASMRIAEAMLMLEGIPESLSSQHAILSALLPYILRGLW